jgi:hypothetical protein
MLRSLLTLVLVSVSFIGFSQISVKKVNSLVGTNWEREKGQIALYKSIEAVSNYFFAFSNATYPEIIDPVTVVFSATEKELNMLYKSALKCFENGESVILKVGDYELELTWDKDLLKKSELSFLFTKAGEPDRLFHVNKRQLKSLFGNKDGRLRY